VPLEANPNEPKLDKNLCILNPLPELFIRAFFKGHLYFLLPFHHFLSIPSGKKNILNTFWKIKDYNFTSMLYGISKKKSYKDFLQPLKLHNGINEARATVSF